MFGLISKLTAVTGERERLASILSAATHDMPGCLSYVIALDTTDADSLWITEVWEDRASHAASLTLPSIQAAIAKAKPFIAGFSNRVETTPVAGQGLPSNRK